MTEKEKTKSERRYMLADFNGWVDRKFPVHKNFEKVIDNQAFNSPKGINFIDMFIIGKDIIEIKDSEGNIINPYIHCHFGRLKKYTEMEGWNDPKYNKVFGKWFLEKMEPLLLKHNIKTISLGTEIIIKYDYNKGCYEIDDIKKFEFIRRTRKTT